MSLTLTMWTCFMKGLGLLQSESPTLNFAHLMRVNSSYKLIPRNQSAWSSFTVCSEGDLLDCLPIGSHLFFPTPPPSIPPSPCRPSHPLRIPSSLNATKYNIQFPTMSSDDVRKFVREAKVKVSQYRLKAKLKAKLTPPWGALATKVEKESWMKNVCCLLSDPSNYVRANPGNLQNLVSCL